MKTRTIDNGYDTGQAEGTLAPEIIKEYFERIATYDYDFSAHGEYMRGIACQFEYGKCIEKVSETQQYADELENSLTDEGCYLAEFDPEFDEENFEAHKDALVKIAKAMYGQALYEKEKFLKTHPEFGVSEQANEEKQKEALRLYRMQALAAEIATRQVLNIDQTMNEDFKDYDMSQLEQELGKLRGNFKTIKSMMEITQEERGIKKASELSYDEKKEIFKGMTHEEQFKTVLEAELPETEGSTQLQDALYASYMTRPQDSYLDKELLKDFSESIMQFPLNKTREKGVELE